jgi:hypothetical protein
MLTYELQVLLLSPEFETADDVSLEKLLSTLTEPRLAFWSERERAPA